MKIIVGLGNPGKQYEQTLHNAGFLVIDACAQLLRKYPSGEYIRAERNALYQSEEFFLHTKSGVRERVVLVKPQTYMNESGRAVKNVMHYGGADVDRSRDLWVIHDDGDISLGMIRLGYDKRAAGHRGVASIIAEGGSQKFFRIRIGIRSTEEKRRTEAFVLRKPRPADRELWKNAIERAAEALIIALEAGPEKARMLMNKKTAITGAVP